MPDAQAAGKRPLCFLIRRQFSFTPERLGWLFLIAVGFSFCVALAFSLFGAWPVLVFAGLQAAAMLGAFLWHERHVGDFERITIHAERVVFEMSECNRVRRVDMPARWLRIMFDSHGERLFLVAPGRRIEIGAFLAPAERARLADEMKRRLFPDQGAAGESNPRRVNL